MVGYDTQTRMSSGQPSLQELSSKLSEVLEDIGVNDEMIQKRRQCAFFKEALFFVHELIVGKGMVHMTHFIFGSQSEGTTTLGMKSDKDLLHDLTYDNVNVIDDLSNWQIGKINLLMVQDETTAPGYCLLQLLRDDVPLPAECIPNDPYCIDDKGRVLVKQKTFEHFDDRFDTVQHGPATTVKREGMNEMDCVLALHCSKWPAVARQWLTRDNVDGWPNASLKSQCEKSGCFLVPVDSKISGLVGVEWRISTSLAERFTMLSLNNTHLKCYIIMKQLLKEYTVFQNVISSYMCKTALLHCVENTRVKFWQDRNLIACLNKLLNELYNNIAHVKCSHFFIPENNLMAGKIAPSQQHTLLDVLDRLIKSGGRMLLDVQIDDLGYRLMQKLKNVPLDSHLFMSNIKTHRYISGVLSISSALCVIASFKSILIKFNVLCHENTIQTLKLKYKEIRNIYPQLDITKRKAARYLTSLIRTTVGTLMASHSISIQRSIPDQAIEWLKSGLNSDVSSSMLKLATVYYSSGNMNGTVDLLTRVDQMYDRNVVISACGCKAVNCDRKIGFEKAAYNRQVTQFRRIVSYCVYFMNHESHIVPSEMRQEFFRSFPEEIQHSLDEDRMDLAVIDSLPYLYFLQYKTYKSLVQNEKKQNALDKLKNVMNEEPRLRHLDTVYNILGQCMEQENLFSDALQYYEQSLKITPQHNAANFHISRLKNTLFSE